MDDAREAEEYDAMDFLEPNTRFAEDAVRYVKGHTDPEVLDLGTGTARIPILMAERHPTARILALDAAREMIRVGTRNVIAAGLADRVKLQQMDVKAMRLPKHAYDLVMCNSTIHHIPDPVVVFREIGRLTKPGGAIVVRDLARPASFEAAWAIVKGAAAGESRKQQQLFFDSLCAALTIPEVEKALVTAGLPGLKVAMVSERHWTAEGRKSAMRATGSVPPASSPPSG